MAIVDIDSAFQENLLKSRNDFINSKLRHSIKPLFLNNHGKFSSCGTCVFVKYQNYCFILTAKHCLEQEYTPYIVTAERNIPVDGEWQMFNHDEIGDVDITFREIGNLGKYSIEETHLFLIDMPLQTFTFNDWFISSGFPYSMNKNVKIKNRWESAESAVRYTRDYELIPLIGEKIDDGVPINLSTHLPVIYTLKNGFWDENGNNIEHHISPIGLSGGPLIYLNHSDAILLEKPVKYNLAGILVGIKEGLVSKDYDGNDVKFDVAVSVQIDLIKQGLNAYISSKYTN